MVRCVWELIAVVKSLPDFQVKGFQGARDAANHHALLGGFGEKAEGTEAAWYCCPALPSGLTVALWAGGLLAGLFP